MANSSGGVTRKLVEETVVAAIQMFFDSEDLSLLKFDANERSISHRLAIHLERAIADRPEWGKGLHIDCEYNRDVENPDPPYSKKLQLPQRHDISNEDTEATTVFPDIIVHRRNSVTNLLVVEIKKEGSGSLAKAFDLEKKLPAYLNQLGYRFGVFVALGVGTEAGKFTAIYLP